MQWLSDPGEFARCNFGGVLDETSAELLHLAHLHGSKLLSIADAARIQSLMEALWNLKDLKLYPLIAEFAVTLARHEECLSDFDWKGELQERGSMLHYETALQLLKSVNRMAEAQEIFDEAVSW